MFIPDPEILIFYPSRIPDPGVEKASDPGSGLATMLQAWNNLWYYSVLHDVYVATSFIFFCIKNRYFSVIDFASALYTYYN